jgi:Fe2+ transport system protein FeoA
MHYAEVLGMPLSLVKAGKRVQIAAIKASDEYQGRLAAMGMVTGAVIEVLCNTVRGPFIVSLKGSRIMLGREMAQRIFVS